jgi:hypothetical protein
MSGAATELPETDQGQAAISTVEVALLVAPGQAAGFADDLAAVVEQQLRRLGSDAGAKVHVVQEPMLGRPAPTMELVDALRQRLVGEGWDLAIGVADVPLRLGRHLVAGHASPVHGVALLSLPALGPTRTGQHARDALVRLLDEVLGEDCGDADNAGRTRRLRARLIALRDVGDSPEGLAYVLGGGHLRLLAGLVAANQPWRLTARLSRALTAALAAVVFALVTPDLWQLADALDVARLAVLTVLSVGGSAVALVLVHGLWERSSRPGARTQVLLFNLATSLTVLLGVATLYLALLVITLAGAWLVVPTTLLAASLGHPVTISDYLALAWLVSSLATAGGGLGGGLETDATVREATYASDGDDDAAPNRERSR